MSQKKAKDESDTWDNNPYTTGTDDQDWGSPAEFDPNTNHLEKEPPDSKSHKKNHKKKH